MDDKKVKRIVKERYSEIARNSRSGCSCSCGCNQTALDLSKAIGYSEDDIASVPEGANLGLGCGNPVALTRIKEGDVVLDLGSGAGFDAFLAARQTGEKGRVIGVDMTEEMVEKARENAKRWGYGHVEFRLGEIENLPVDDSSVDVIVSNCVINLSPDKLKVFREAYRVLKNSGRMYISDIVLLDELSEEQKNDEELLAGCVGGALLKEDYITLIKKAGFEVKILSENKGISNRQYQGLPLESIMIEATK